MIHLAHVGLGPIGRRVLEDFLARGLGRIVAAFDTDPRLAGRPLAELVPGAPADLAVRAELEAFEGWGEVQAALVTTTSRLDRVAPTLSALCAHGLCIVSSCEELVFPWLRHPHLADELDQRARESGSRLLGTGVNPGFLMDALPLYLSALCGSVRSVEVERVQDAAPRRLPFQRKVGAGLSPEDFEREAAAGRLGHVGLPESLHFLAHYLGWQLAEWSESLEPIMAGEQGTLAATKAAAGSVAGLRQLAEGRTREGHVLRLAFQAAVGQREARDRVRIEGEPPLECLVPGGVHGDAATSAVLVNALPALLEATPGLHTMASLRPPRYVPAG